MGAAFSSEKYDPITACFFGSAHDAIEVASPVLIIKPPSEPEPEVTVTHDRATEALAQEEDGELAATRGVVEPSRTVETEPELVPNVGEEVAEVPPEPDSPIGIDSFFNREPASSSPEEVAQDKDLATAVAGGAPTGSSLAEILARYEELGDVDAVIEEENRKQLERTAEADHLAREMVLSRFMEVMGSEGPGLKVKKYHRHQGEKGRWAKRVIRYVEGEGGGSESYVTWNTKKLFSREDPHVELSKVTKVESSRCMVWISTTDGARLCIETKLVTDAKLLVQSLEYLLNGDAPESGAPVA